jgi:TrmH family RNA methyltransferase
MAPAPLPIRSRDNPRLAWVRRLTRDGAAYRRSDIGAALWLEGDHLLRACAARGRPLHTVLITPAAWERPALRELAQRAGSVLLIEAALFAELSELPSASGIGALIERPAPNALRAGLDTVILDRLQDAGNVGSILRSTAALGAAQVVALPGTVALWSPKVLRAGMGAHFALSLHESASAEALAALTQPWLATSSHAGVALHAAALPRPAAWVFGHEGQGVAPALQARCALTVRIAQPGGEESLNVAAAAAICLYEALRQRLQ